MVAIPAYWNICSHERCEQTKYVIANVCYDGPDNNHAPNSAEPFLVDQHYIQSSMSSKRFA